MAGGGVGYGFLAHKHMYEYIDVQVCLVLQTGNFHLFLRHPPDKRQTSLCTMSNR
jgi:hypothetical protein